MEMQRVLCEVRTELSVLFRYISGLELLKINDTNFKKLY
jgi:hypothetical protein